MELSEEAPKVEEQKGLSLGLATVFIVGQMAGSGVLALPKAFEGMGWSSIGMIILCCLNSLCSGICLGHCWLILEERWSEYKEEKSRYPYPAIALRAVGPIMRHVVSVCIDVTLFGVATVFLLLSSQIIGNMAGKFGISFCHWILILATILCPLMWLGTPHDFWPAAVLAVATTMLACVLLLIAIALDETDRETANYPSPTLESFFLAFGTLLFAFGGASTFPTFQNDMKDKSQFPLAAVIGFAVLICLYTPVATMGYIFFGDRVDENVLRSVNPSILKIAIEVLFALHLFFAFLLSVNPPTQEIEEHLNVSTSFSWKRCVVRTCILLLIVFIGLTIPRFGKVLNLVGGSTITLLTFVFPPIFYILLCKENPPEWPGRHIPIPLTVYLVQIIIVGIIGGCISTYSSIVNIAAPKAFNPPCYINITAASKQ